MYEQIIYYREQVDEPIPLSPMASSERLFRLENTNINDVQMQGSNSKYHTGSPSVRYLTERISSMLRHIVSSFISQPCFVRCHAHSMHFRSEMGPKEELQKSASASARFRNQQTFKSCADNVQTIKASRRKSLERIQSLAVSHLYWMAPLVHYTQHILLHFD